MILTELHVDLKSDHGRVAELERFELAQESAGSVLFGEGRKYRICGTASVVQQLDLLLVDAALGHQIPGEDVEDALAVQLDSEVERFAELRAADVVAVFVDDSEENLRLRRRAVDDGGGDAGEVISGVGGVFRFDGSINRTKMSNGRKRSRGEKK